MKSKISRKIKTFFFFFFEKNSKFKKLYIYNKAFQKRKIKTKQLKPNVIIVKAYHIWKLKNV